MSSPERETTTLIYRTKACKNLVQEIYQFEGWQVPTCLSEIPKSKQEERMGDVVIVDLTDSDDILSSVKHLNNTISNSKVMVIFGKEDSIRTLRRMEQLGLYYFPWPIDRHELTDSLKQIFQPHNVHSIQSYSRKAKRIAVIGSRGGVGASNIAIEITAQLAQRESRSILVDHDFNNSNIDIILSKKDLSRLDTSTMTVDIEELDADSANNYLSKVANNFFYLGAVGILKQETLEKYTNTITNTLINKANFIIDDYSASVDFVLDIGRIINESNIIVLVLDPSVSSVRSAQTILDKINESAIASRERVRVITVVNFHRPPASFNFNHAEVERFLNHRIDVEIPYYKQAMVCTIEGRRLHSLESRKSRPFSELFELINGKVVKEKRGFLANFRRRGSDV